MGGSFMAKSCAAATKHSTASHTGAHPPIESTAMDARLNHAGGIEARSPIVASRGNDTAFLVLCAVSLSHGLNDIIQSLVPAIYPVLKSQFNLDVGQIGLITLPFPPTA